MDSEIIKSPNDKLLYKSIVLPNKLQALLISDSEADKCSASLSVNVGSLLDPNNIPGLAHFLEHMLFLGTSKYPNEAEYKDYISKHSGDPNAYTSMTETVYYFECSKDALNGALDRFSQFFVSPLFSDTCTDREMQAVHSEHQKNLLNDFWKKLQMIRSSAKKNHPYNRFSTGNLETLKVENIREELLAFYDKYYSANIMKLVVYGIESLEVLEKWVVEMFSDVKNKDVIIPELIEKPFDEENMGEFWKVLPTRDNDYLEIVWIIDYLMPHYRANPGKYISHLFGHEGKNSLLSLLIDEGLALELSAGNSDEINSFSKITISIKLTKQGLSNPLLVLEYVFAYLKMLKLKGTQDFEYVFEEIKKVNELKFLFKEKERAENYVVGLSASLQKYPVQDILKLNYFMEKFQPDLIKQFLDNLKLENMRVYLISLSIASELNMEEPIYKTKYSLVKFDKEIIEKFNNPQVNPKISKKKLELPVANIFLPQNLEIRTNEATPYPQKLMETTQSLVYFKQDDAFKTPKGAIFLRILTTSEGFPRHCKYFVWAKIWQDLFHNDLRESLYLAEMAEIYSGIYSHSFGIDVKIQGFNDSLKKWMQEIIEKLVSFDPTNEERKFNMIHNKVQMNFKNFEKSQPYSISSQNMTVATRDVGVFENNECLNIINNMTFQDFVDLSKDWLKYVRFEWLVLGNLESSSITELVNFTEEKFKEKGSILLEKENATQVRIYKFKKNVQLVYEYFINEPKQNNSDVLIQYQDERHPKSKILCLILENYLNAPFFQELRTKQQIGYIVFVYYDEFRGIHTINFEIQSERFPSHENSLKITEFLDSMKEKINQLEEEEFSTYKSSVLNRITEKDLNIYKEIERYWFEVVSHQYVFDRKEKNTEIINNLTKEEFISFCNRFLWEKPRILEMHSICEKHKTESKNLKEERIAKNPKLKEVQSLKICKSGMTLYPDFFSYFQENNK